MGRQHSVLYGCLHHHIYVCICIYVSIITCIMVNANKHSFIHSLNYVIDILHCEYWRQLKHNIHLM